MRKRRLTFIGAFHHVMNHGINGMDVFPNDRLKGIFLNLVREKSRLLKIEIYAYCILDSHFHIVLQNSVGKMSEFLRQICSQYASMYRRIEGGRGYVFQDRFMSTLIQDDSYLKMSILYVLLNPVRARIVLNPFSYNWSSINEYFSKDKDNSEKIVGGDFVEGLFVNKKNLTEGLNAWIQRDLPVEKTVSGQILGAVDFKNKAGRLFKSRSNEERRENPIGNKKFQAVSEIIREFEERNGVDLQNLNFISFSEKRLRGRLLVLLKDKGGLTYSEILRFPVFKSLKFSSLGQIYKREKAK